VLLLPTEDGDDVADAVAQLGLDGVRLLDRNRQGSTLLLLPLESVARWAVRDPTILTLYCLKPGGGGERVVQLSSDERITRSMVDVLVSSCLQLCELRGVDTGEMMESMGAGSGTNSLAAAVAAAAAAAAAAERDKSGPVGRGAALLGRGPARTADPGAAAVEFWKGEEASGWLLKKGERLSTWRRRWFVLKDGRLFWFLDDKVSAQVRARGSLPLRAARAAPGGGALGARSATLTEAGKAYALEVFGPDAAATGCRYLAAESEAEKERWVAALCKAAGKAAGEGGGGGGGGGDARSHEDWASQLRQGMQQLSTSDRGGGGGSGGGGASSYDRARGSSSGGGGGGVSYSSYEGRGGGGSDYGGGGGGGWERVYDNSGRAYYHEPRSGRTQWEAPPGFRG